MTAVMLAWAPASPQPRGDSAASCSAATMQVQNNVD